MLVGLAVAAYVVLANRNEDVHRGGEVEFNAAKPPKPKDDSTTPWPFYHDLRATSYLRADLESRPTSAGGSSAAGC